MTAGKVAAIVGGICCLCCFLVLGTLAILFFAVFRSISLNPEIQFYAEETIPDPTLWIPATKILDRPIQVGDLIHIHGKGKMFAFGGFCVQLAEIGQSVDVPMKLCATFDPVRKIQYTATEDGKLKVNETAPNPLKSDGQIDLRIRVLPEHLQVFVGQGEVGVFPRVPLIYKARNLTLSGEVKDLKVMRVQGDLYRNEQSLDIDLTPKNTRMDLVATPIASYPSELEWKNLIEGRNGTGDIHLTRKRSSNYIQTQHTYPAQKKFIFKAGADFESIFFRDDAALMRDGAFKYSPEFGGYYNLNVYNGSTDNVFDADEDEKKALLYVPASFAHRFHESAKTFYTPSNGHGKHVTNKVPIDFTKIPRAKSFVFTFSNSIQVPVMKITFSKEETVLEVLIGKKWQRKIVPTPIDDWRLFDLTVIHEKDSIDVYLNRYPFFSIESDKAFDFIKFLSFSGDVEVMSVTRQGKTVNS